MAKKPNKQRTDFVRHVHGKWAANPKDSPREFRMDKGSGPNAPVGKRSAHTHIFGDSYRNLSTKDQVKKVYEHLNANPSAGVRYKDSFYKVYPDYKNASSKQGSSFSEAEFRTQRAPQDFQHVFPTIHAAGGKLKSAGSYVGGKAKAGVKQARMVPVGPIEDAGIRRWTEGHTDSVRSAVRLMEQRGKLDSMRAREALKDDLKTLKAWEGKRRNFGTLVTKYKDPAELHKQVLVPIGRFRKEVKGMPNELRNSNTVKAWSSAADQDYGRAERKGGVSEMRAGMSAAERKVGYFRLGQWGGTKRGDIADTAVAEAQMVEQEEGAGKKEAKARGGRKHAEAREKEADVRMKRALSEQKYEGARAEEQAQLEDAKLGKKGLLWGRWGGGAIKTQTRTMKKTAEASELEADARKVEAQRQIEEAERGRAMLKGEASMTGTTEEVSLRRRQLAGTRAVAEAFEEAGHVETGKGRIAREEVERFIEEMREGARPDDARYDRLKKALKVARAEGSTPEFLMEADNQMKLTQSADRTAQNWQKARKRT